MHHFLWGSILPRLNRWSWAQHLCSGSPFTVFHTVTHSLTRARALDYFATFRAKKRKTYVRLVCAANTHQILVYVLDERVHGSRKQKKTARWVWTEQHQASKTQRKQKKNNHNHKNHRSAASASHFENTSCAPSAWRSRIDTIMYEINFEFQWSFVVNLMSHKFTVCFVCARCVRCSFDVQRIVFTMLTHIIENLHSAKDDSPVHTCT